MRTRQTGIKMSRFGAKQNFTVQRPVPVKTVVTDFISVSEDIVKNKSLNHETRAEMVELMLQKLTMLTNRLNHPDEFKSVRAILLDAVNTKPLGVSILKITSDHYFRNDRSTLSPFKEFGFDDFSNDVFVGDGTRPMINSAIVGTILGSMNLKDALDKLSDDQIEIIREVYIPLYQVNICEIDSPRWFHATADVITSSVVNFITVQILNKRTPMTYIINRLELIKNKFKSPMFEDMIKSGELEQLVSSKLKTVYDEIDALEISKIDENQKDLYKVSVEMAKDLIKDTDAVGNRIIKVCEKLTSLKEEYDLIGFIDRGENVNTKVEQYGILSSLAELTDRVSNPWASLVIYNLIVNMITEIYVERSSVEDFKELLLINDNR